MPGLIPQNLVPSPMELSLTEALGVRSIVLIGMMGAGKSSVGRRLGLRLGLPAGGVIYTDRNWEVAVTPQNLIDQTLTRPELAQWIFEQVGVSPCKKSCGSSQVPQR